MSTLAYGAHAADRKLEPMAIQRRAVGAADVRIDIAYCGLCHSDIHQVRSEWAGTKYPCVPGHEIVGRVAEVGSAVTSFKAGDLVGVGCIVDSCRHCAECNDGLENYCDRMVGTYNGATPDAPGHTLGGYSQHIVVDQRYVLRVRHAEAQLPAVAPLLCAGITTWSPLRHWGVKAGMRVGIVGIGGLGHMGIKLAHALGAEVVASRHPSRSAPQRWHWVRMKSWSPAIRMRWRRSAASWTSSSTPWRRRMTSTPSSACCVAMAP